MTAATPGGRRSGSSCGSVDHPGPYRDRSAPHAHDPGRGGHHLRNPLGQAWHRARWRGLPPLPGSPIAGGAAKSPSGHRCDRRATSFYDRRGSYGRPIPTFLFWWATVGLALATDAIHFGTARLRSVRLAPLAVRPHLAGNPLANKLSRHRGARGQTPKGRAPCVRPDAGLLRNHVPQRCLPGTDVDLGRSVKLRNVGVHASACKRQS